MLRSIRDFCVTVICIYRYHQFVLRIDHRCNVQNLLFCFCVWCQNIDKSAKSQNITFFYTLLREAVRKKVLEKHKKRVLAFSTKIDLGVPSRKVEKQNLMLRIMRMRNNVTCMVFCYSYILQIYSFLLYYLYCVICKKIYLL